MFRCRTSDPQMDSSGPSPALHFRLDYHYNHSQHSLMGTQQVNPSQRNQQEGGAVSDLPNPAQAQQEEQEYQQMFDQLMLLGKEWKEKLQEPLLQALVKEGRVHLDPLVLS